ncbi:hypothetical protein FEP39_05618 [Burkholderia multivorans]|nr:hypothetical protein [Burkholderia multivorans]MDR9060484.1 hypothetical protein [Burkholderia multivorans]MDR9066404.1 hypothetical protein [Burkholderia multivorans]MDR9072360.1 hypothetical protein [Burkholderia multivorans]MDR9078348.1 hypothetical protein [Burkholderia multivorans]
MKPYAKDARNDDRNTDSADAADLGESEGFESWYERRIFDEVYHDERG